MKPSPSRVDVALQLWVVLARSSDAVERHSRSSIARSRLSTTEFGVLEVLYHKGELPVCEVQRRILVESSSRTYVVDKLVRRGLVRRRHSGTDRRVVLLALTSAGRRLIQRIFPPHAHAMRRANKTGRAHARNPDTPASPMPSSRCESINADAVR